MAWTERYVRADAAGGGDGTTDTNSGANGAWTLAEAITNYASGQRLNVRAGTYSNTTTDRTFGTAGTTTAPIWWRGFNTTAGDIDTDNTLTKPAITFSTGRFIISATHQYFSNLDISGAQTTNGQVRLQTYSTGLVRFDRCRIECTAANANGRAISQGASGILVLSRCSIRATSSTDVIASAAASPIFLSASAIRGGGDGIELGSGGNLIAEQCVFDDNGASGINISAGMSVLSVTHCSFYSGATDGVRIAALPAIGLIGWNVFSDIVGTGINNATGTNTNLIQRIGNDFYNNGATEAGFGDAPTFGDVTESSSPFTNAASHDFSLVTGANAKAVGLPGAFENESYTSYLDLGAVQRQEPTGSGGGPLVDARLIG